MAEAGWVGCEGGKRCGEQEGTKRMEGDGEDGMRWGGWVKLWRM
jgi:hypothetical protein